MNFSNDHRPETIIDSFMPRSGLWGRLAFWGLHGWVLAYSIVMLGAFFIQFVEGEFPCPLCMLQRYGMFLSTMGALFVIMQARSGVLTASRYAQGLGMGLIGALAGAMVSLRQIALHIMPGDPGYGLPILGFHLYTWAFITFAVVLIYSGVALTLAPRSIPVAPSATSTLRWISNGVVWLFIAVAAANVIAILFLEGFAWVLADNPVNYHLIEQLTGR